MADSCELYLDEKGRKQCRRHGPMWVVLPDRSTMGFSAADTQFFAGMAITERCYTRVDNCVPYAYYNAPELAGDDDTDRRAWRQVLDRPDFRERYETAAALLQRDSERRKLLQAFVEAYRKDPGVPADDMQ